MTDPPHSSTQIAALRTAMGLSQAEFAQLFGVHPMTVSKWERDRQPPLAKPTAYQTALMRAFTQAVRGKKQDMPDQVKNRLVGAGVIAALFYLLSQANK